MLATFLASWTERGRVEAVELDLASERYPDLARIYDYWRERCRGRFAPSRADVDPVDLKDVLPRVMLADVVAGRAGAPEFRYRLAGTGICSVHGEDATGKSPRAFMPAEYGALIQVHYREAVARRRPILHLIVLDTLERSRCYARLILPLSEDGSTVTMLMTVDSREQNTEALRRFFAGVADER